MLGANVLPMELLVVFGALAMMLLVEVFNRKSIYGKAFVATSNDRDAAGLMGINTGMVITFSYALSSLTAAFAGVLVAPLTLTGATMGAVLGLKAFAVAIIGGLSSGMGVVVGGLILASPRPPPASIFDGIQGRAWTGAAVARADLQTRRPVRQDRDQEGVTTMKPLHLLLSVVAVACLAAVPLGVTNTYYLHLIETIMIYAILLFGLDIVVGYTGQVSLGHAGLFGIGSYVAGVLFFHLQLPIWLTLPAAILIAAAFGAVLALPALRVTGPYLAMVTLASAPSSRSSSTR